MSAPPKTLTLLIMDPPYESSSTLTAFRICEAALKRGCHVNVFAFEGAVHLSFARQAVHPNPVHETTAEQEQHPLTRDFVSGLFALARERGVKLDWINCGFCVDERGAGEWVEGPRRGGPADFLKAVQGSDQTLVMAAR